MRKVDGRSHDERVGRVTFHPHDERLIELDLAHRQAPEVGERGVPGAVVVDRKAATQRTKALQILDPTIGVIDNCTFGDFQRYPLRGATIVRQHRRNAVGQLRIQDVVGRNVD